jgi:hypothetical protein
MNGRGSVFGMASDELKTFRTRVSLSRRSKGSFKRGKPIRAALGLSSHYGGMIDEGWIYVTFR